MSRLILLYIASPSAPGGRTEQRLSGLVFVPHAQFACSHSYERAQNQSMQLETTYGCKPQLGWLCVFK